MGGAARATGGGAGSALEFNGLPRSRDSGARVVDGIMAGLLL
jgi:hypothetical protein